MPTMFSFEIHQEGITCDEIQQTLSALGIEDFGVERVSNGLYAVEVWDEAIDEDVMTELVVAHNSV